MSGSAHINRGTLLCMQWRINRARTHPSVSMTSSTICFISFISIFFIHSLIYSLLFDPVQVVNKWHMQKIQRPQVSELEHSNISCSWLYVAPSSYTYAVQPSCSQGGMLCAQCTYLQFRSPGVDFENGFPTAQPGQTAFLHPFLGLFVSLWFTLEHKKLVCEITTLCVSLESSLFRSNRNE